MVKAITKTVTAALLVITLTCTGQAARAPKLPATKTQTIEVTR